MKIRTAVTAAALALGALAAAGRAHAHPVDVDPTATDAPVRMVLNIPAGRLDLFRGAEHVKSYPVSVGTASHRTPSGSFQLRHAIWNPDWTPPKSEWARNRKHTPPGPGNPMGRVKLHLADDVYIHGTPGHNERLLGTPASHGCIRMSNRDVMELARTLHAHASPGVTERRLDGIAAAPSRTEWVALSKRVPLEVVYQVVEVRGGELVVHPDVYGRVRNLEPEIRTALLRAGYHPSALDGEAMDRVEAGSRRGERAALALAELRRPPAPTLQVAGI